jgi:hypothetical protein
VTVISKKERGLRIVARALAIGLAWALVVNFILAPWLGFQMTGRLWILLIVSDFVGSALKVFTSPTPPASVEKKP